MERSTEGKNLESIGDSARGKRVNVPGGGIKYIWGELEDRAPVRPHSRGVPRVPTAGESQAFPLRGGGGGGGGGGGAGGKRRGADWPPGGSARRAGGLRRSCPSAWAGGARARKRSRKNARPPPPPASAPRGSNLPPPPPRRPPAAVWPGLVRGRPPAPSRRCRYILYFSNTLH